MLHRDVYVGFALQQQSLSKSQHEVCNRFGLSPRAELHVTLGFLGNVPEQELLRLSRSLSPLAEKKLATLPITGVGGIYKEENELKTITDETDPNQISPFPRVMWWTVEHELLPSFRAFFLLEISKLNISPAFLRYSPHITLGSFSTSQKTWDIYDFNKQKTLSWKHPTEAIIEKFHITKTELHPQSLHVLTEPNIPRGLVVWLTGWPASGKSTLARMLRKELLQRGRESVLLDSDEIRNQVFPSLGYNDDDRKTFYAYLTNLAAFLARQGSIVLVPATANKRIFREEARNKCHAFIEVYINSSREESSARDPKKLYQEQKIDFIYEPPLQPEIEIAGLHDTQSIETLISMIQKNTK